MDCPERYADRTVRGRKVREHVLVAERALGRALPQGAVVHHVDENKSNNTPSNLVVCEDRAYHNLLHARIRALRETGHANHRPCRYCKRYDSPANLTVVRRLRGPKKGQELFYHAKCSAEQTAARRKNRSVQ